MLLPSATPSYSRLADFSAGLITALVIVYGTKKFAHEWRQRSKVDPVLPPPAIEHQVTVQPIGVMRSVYRLCVGTPRQGLLAPSARGRIELIHLPYDHALAAVDGCDAFSHVWIMFVFHLNTRTKKKNSQRSSTPLKIAAPARGGAQRVGVLATRSPHRFNPIGITLAKLDSVETLYRKKNASDRKAKRIISLSVSGLDLVDGTPIVDIKPYVGVYDSVPHSTIPPWVAQGLATRRRVEWNDRAVQQLDTLVNKERNKLEFFAAGETRQVRACIDDVLAVDVRSAFQTQKARAGKFQAERSQRIQKTQQQHESEKEEGQCTQQLDNLIISYDVRETSNTVLDAAADSGAEDHVIVQSVRML